MTKHGSDHVATNPDPAAFAHWPEGLYADMLAGRNSGCVGSLLVSETDRVRVWHLSIPVGGRCGFHRHVNPYFWSALAAGTARAYCSSGKISEATYTVGQTQHYYYGPGDYMVHSLENIGDTELAFATVEFLDETNPAIDIPLEFKLVTA